MTLNLSRRAHGIQRARDELRGPRPIAGVRGLGLEQLCVGQNDPQLIIQLVEQHAQVG